MSDIDFSSAGYEAILEATNSKDPEVRKLVSSQLSAMGLKPPQYLRWSPEQRAKAIAEHYESAGGGKKPAKSAAKAPAAKAEKTEKASSEGTTPKSGISKADLEAVEARIMARIDESLEVLNEALSFVKETHFLGVASAATLGADIEDTETFGSLVFADEGNEEG
jgi:hypothetical protein